MVCCSSQSDEKTPSGIEIDVITRSTSPSLLIARVAVSSSPIIVSSNTTGEGVTAISGAMAVPVNATLNSLFACPLSLLVIVIFALNSPAVAGSNVTTTLRVCRRASVT